MTPVIIPERTLVFVEPEVIDCEWEIFSRLDAFGNRIYDRRINNLPSRVIEEHYAVHRDKPYFHVMTSSYNGKPIHLAIYEAFDDKGIIDKIKRMQGCTNPLEAAHGTIRGDFASRATEKIVEILPEGRLVRGIMHAADSQESYERESKVWERFLGIRLAFLSCPG